MEQMHSPATQARINGFASDATIINGGVRILFATIDPISEGAKKAKKTTTNAKTLSGYDKITFEMTKPLSTGNVLKKAQLPFIKDIFRINKLIIIADNKYVDAGKRDKSNISSDKTNKR